MRAHKANDLHQSIRRDPFHVLGACLQNEIQRVGIIGRPRGLSVGQLEIERNSDAAGDLVLQCEQIANIAVELLRPQMRIRLGIDQLSVDAHFAARPPNAAFEDISYAQLAADLLGVDPPVPVSECGIARDHKAVCDARQICRPAMAPGSNNLSGVPTDAVAEGYRTNSANSAGSGCLRVPARAKNGAAARQGERTI